ncbi:DUF86 domain-containing protein [Varibaculum cambriense]|uniref:HepT-like ribonuclease domain-containing protein n=1 Tax=Varibaculum cambriense TaxID=184870 RepID=UPI002B25B498|nr:HepT-like ribonuclease domain-containing protein [Varibaculum cambriense]
MKTSYAAKTFYKPLINVNATWKDQPPDSSAEFTEMVEDAIERNLQIIGEAVSRLSSTGTDSNPEIRWAQIRGFRNILVHEYFGVDIQIIRDVVENHLPALTDTLGEYLKRTQP